jgi:hypothetical protein
MKKIIHRLFFVWQFEKEEKWLNEMSQKGLQLEAVGFCRYQFTEGGPGEYIYRLEMLKHHPNSDEGRRYIESVEKTGAEHVGSLLRWVYFRKKAGSEGFDIFSDIDSRIKHLERIMSILVPSFLLIGVSLGLQLRRQFDVVVGVITLIVWVLQIYCLIRLLIAWRSLRKSRK